MSGNGKQEDIENLKRLADTIVKASVCGLGQTAPNPVLSTMKYFMNEYEEHVKDHKCKANECKALSQILIDPEKCKKCHMCAKACPVNAIKGEPKEIHEIDQTKCIKCRSCVNACPFKAIS